MSGRARRPADGPPEGQPPAKKPPMDIAAIRAQIAAKKAAVEAKLAAREGSGSASASPAPPASASAHRERERDDRGRDRGRDDRDRDRDRGYRGRDDRDRDDRGRDDRRDDRDRDRDRDRGYRGRDDRGRRDSRDSPRDSPRDRGSPAAPGPAALPPKPTVDPGIIARIAAAKARIDALKNKQPTPANPYVASASAPRPASSGVALHPLLMEGANAGPTQEKNEKKAMQNRYKTMAPKFSTVRANAAAVEEAHRAMLKTPSAAIATVVTNPYAPAPTAGPGPGPGPQAGPGEDGVGGVARQRKSRKMQFSAPGKYVRQGDQLRNEIKLEELKQRIAEQSRKAGLDSEFDVLERSLKRQPPPTVEWWDEAILPTGNTYDDIESAEQWFRTTNDSLITHLVQHPIPIPAPSDRKETVRGLMLTKKEQKKIRRNRRQAEHEEKRDKQKMGLIPPDPPKVKLGNLMKVLTSDAVQDPTKVEAKVRREVAMRAYMHDKDNEDRKLTKEERQQKEFDKIAKKERDGLYATAYLVRYLTNGRHKFKVRETAKHDMLSGLCIFHPNFALILVEGVDKKIKHYKQLMTHRIDWTEEARARAGDSGSEDEEDGDQPRGEGEEGPDMAENKCEVIWEGEVPERTFKIFRARHAETDSAGKDLLTPKYEGLWDMAKRWKWQDEDL